MPTTHARGCSPARTATSITANALHPGLVSTALGASDPGRAQRLFVPVLQPFMQTPAQGAATSIHLASAPDLDRATGRYFTKNMALLDVAGCSIVKVRDGRLAEADLYYEGGALNRIMTPSGEATS